MSKLSTRSRPRASTAGAVRTQQDLRDEISSQWHEEPAWERGMFSSGSDFQDLVQSIDMRSTDPKMDECQSSCSKQRKIVRIFPRGSFVEIYSGSQRQWYLDGEVVDIAWESSIVDGIRFSAGSSKVVYGSGKHFKWVELHRLEELVRPSRRPQQPKPVVGYVLMEVRSWLGGWWKWTYFQLSKGDLQWWASEEDASAGQMPEGTMKLLGARPEKEVLCIKLITPFANLTLKEKSGERADRLISSIKSHASYCEEDLLSFQTIQTSST